MKSILIITTLLCVCLLGQQPIYAQNRRALLHQDSILTALQKRYPENKLLHRKHKNTDAMKRATLRLDSTRRYKYDEITDFWERNKRTIYQYPSPNDEIVLYHSWNQSTLTWEAEYRDLFSYDPTTLVEDFVYQEWDDATDEWVNQGRTLIEYDAQDRMIRFAFFEGESGLWVGDEQYLYTYLNQGLEIEEVSQYWNDMTNSWENEDKYLEVYNADSIFLSSIEWEWDAITQTWLDSDRTTSALNSQGLIASELNEDYDPTTMMWNPRYQYLYFYNAQAQETERIDQIWDQGLSTWMNEDRTLRTYYPSQLLNSSIGQFWDSLQATWINDYRWLNTYDNNGNVISWTSQFWIESLGGWETHKQVLNAWDSNDWLIEETYSWKGLDYYRATYQRNAEGETEERIIYSDYGDGLGILREERKDEYFWSSVSTSIADRFQNLACAIPNPLQANQLYTCSSLEPNTRYELQVYDLSGRKMQHTHFHGQEGFSLKGAYSQGLYLIMITGDGALLYRKKILMR